MQKGYDGYFLGFFPSILRTKQPQVISTGMNLRENIPL